eukprot:TRINITY_DN65964_c0_g1_i1.p1 TRINITY_DN65964_c0_g1~~TRINITY_DN65964_c0_g1_i1.p1  ORF type:complete len:1148 (+),score=145.80 TRINITY_DN65964_c0_g1_i1:360-3446(+)
MTTCGINAQEQEEIWKTVGGILNLMSVEYTEADDKASFDSKSDAGLKNAAALWQIDGTVFEKELLTTTTVTRGEALTRNHTKIKAVDTRDSLSKAVYDGLFTWLVDKINETASSTDFDNFVGLLDIFGFEDFEINSFEQLCINLANESLQQHYNIYIFNKDLEECRGEGIDVTSVEFPDNTPCLELLTSKMGVMALLDEECQLGKGSDEGFLNNLNQHKSHAFFQRSPLMKDCFCIIHYAATVKYTVQGWLEKNRDTLKDDIKLMMRASGSSLVKELLPEPVETRGKKPTVSGMFKTQLSGLMDLINSTNPHWIRCIKPHPAKKPMMWENASVFNQLSSSGIIGTVRVRKAGFPVRIHFPDFAKRFRLIKPGPIDDAKGRSELIVSEMGFSKQQCQIGTVRVFLKSEAYTELEGAVRKASQKYIVAIQSWARKMNAEVDLRHLEFKANREAILASIKHLLALQKEEMDARKELESQCDQEWADAVEGDFSNLEGMARDAITAQEDKEFSEMMAEEEDIRTHLMERIEKERAERIAREEAERSRIIVEEEDARDEWTGEEDLEWNKIVYGAANEVREREETKDAEDAMRMAIEAEEDAEWASISYHAMLSYREHKAAEEERMAAEWQDILADVTQQREEMAYGMMYNEKSKHDFRRTEISNLRRNAYRNQQAQRMPGSLEERAMVNSTQWAFRQEAAHQRAEAVGQNLQQMKLRKEMLLGPSEITRQSKQRNTVENMLAEKAGRMIGDPDQIQQESRAVRVNPALRPHRPLTGSSGGRAGTPSGGFASGLLSQPSPSTVEEIISARERATATPSSTSSRAPREDRIGYKGSPYGGRPASASPQGNSPPASSPHYSTHSHHSPLGASPLGGSPRTSSPNGFMSSPRRQFGGASPASPPTRDSPRNNAQFSNNHRNTPPPSSAQFAAYKGAPKRYDYYSESPTPDPQNYFSPIAGNDRHSPPPFEEHQIPWHPTRTRIAAGLDPQTGFPSKPIRPQPKPAAAPHLGGSLRPATPDEKRQNRRYDDYRALRL